MNEGVVCCCCCAWRDPFFEWFSKGFFAFSQIGHFDILLALDKTEDSVLG
jgi:hypothetical protein